MATLNWIGKQAVVGHDKEVPFKLLKKIKSASVGSKSENLIINGDNLEALKALMPYYAGKIKCVYIDPPYNTGNEGWVYNDKVNSPKIKQWLGKVVGKESEDLTRHDKWLCMMYPRLKLIRDLMAENGGIFVSIDYNEESNLRILMDEIFGARNYRNTFVVSRVKKNIQERDKVKSVNFGYSSILFYAKSERCLVNPPRKPQKKEARWHAFDAPGIRPTMEYAIFGKKPPKSRHWMYSEERALQMIKEKTLRLSPRGSVQYLLKPSDYTLLDTNWTDIQEYDSKWGYPNGEKNINLVKRIIKMLSDSDDVILDSFAGSGTTGHAVLDLNKEDGLNRKFVMVELEDHVAKNIMASRIKKVIKKENYKGGFEYCKLDKPLFGEDGHIEKTCNFKQLATYIYFTETQTNIDNKMMKDNFIGGDNNIEYYLIYKGKDKNDLNKTFLKKLEKNDKRKIVYADRSLVDDDVLKKFNVEFKQIPYEVRVY